MIQSSQPDEITRLENSTYDILRALGKDADFLYDTVDTYIQKRWEYVQSNSFNISKGN
jgi:hypothetical protein